MLHLMALKGTKPSPATLRAKWRTEGFHGDVTLGDVMAEGFAARANNRKVYRSTQRPEERLLGEIESDGLMLAAALWELGLRPGDRVVCQLPNWYENDLLIRACMRLGLVLVPVIHIYGASELSFILRQTEAKALAVPDLFAGTTAEMRLDALKGLVDVEHVLVAGSQIPAATHSILSLVASAAPEPPAVEVNADDVCMIVYTSGTTSDPKGVLHTHNTLLAEKGGAAAVRAKEVLGDRPDLQLFPAGHIAGALGTVFLFAGAPTTVAFDAFDAEQAVRAIDELGSGSTSGATVFLSRMVDIVESGQASLTTLEHFIVGAATVPPEIVERADTIGIKATRCYGSSEHPTVTLSQPSDSLWVRAYTDGPPLPGNEIRIVDEDGNDVIPGEVGEIATRGPELFVGYLDSSLNDAFLDEGWFRTGDVGRLQDGYLIVTDRKKDIIIRGGENISASEVEGVLERLPKVLESAVVAMPDPSLGERVCAFVVLRQGETLDLDQIRAHFREAGVAKQKTPERLEVVTALPRTASGKIQKELLRKELVSSV